MCGIFGLIENSCLNISNNENHEQLVENFKPIITSVTELLQHRGPDVNNNNLIVDPTFDKTVLMVHTRLKITGDNSSQPLLSKDKTMYLIINGEIFNWRELQEELGYECTKSDCEIIFPLYEKYKTDIPKLLNKLRGQFSFLLYDLQSKMILVGRDSIGVTPLYFGYKEHCTMKSGEVKRINRFVISSELKCLTMNEPNQDTFSLVDNIKVFYPRNYLYVSLENTSSNYLDLTQSYTDFYNEFNINSANTIKADVFSKQVSITREKTIIMEKIRHLLTTSIRSQLKDVIDFNVDFGVLLSGGLDSSLIASLVVSICQELGYTKQVKTFSIGVDQSVPDLIAARKVASYLDTDHKEYYFTVSQGINSIRDVIWYAETYDCTTIRASTPMYLLTKAIKSDYKNLKVLFSGELSDELLCYLYGANAPSETDFHLETVNLVSNVHQFDCLRANKMCMANNIEVRVPFTDKDFVSYILNLHPRWKTFGNVPHTINNIEKQILRDSFVGFLPKSILYRKKEQFSDGVSGFDIKNNWINAIQNFCKNKYSELEFSQLREAYTYNKPDTPEKLLYRNIFCELFNSKSYKNTSEFTVKFWEPKWSNSTDPSGRIQQYWSEN